MAWSKAISVVVVMVITVVVIDLLESFLLQFGFGVWASVFALSIVLLVYVAMIYDFPADRREGEDES